MKLSMMQGRLVPPVDNQIQFYPVNNWEEEFVLAKKLGLYSIEWIYEKKNANLNALSTKLGVEKIKSIIKETGVQVKSICADYFMEELLLNNGAIVKKNIEHLEWLCDQARLLDVDYVILPFVDASSLKGNDDIELLGNVLIDFISTRKNLGIEIHIEADLKPGQFIKIFDKVNSSELRMNYDIGNSASLGYDPNNEFEVLGDFLGSIHIKDRVLGGTTVPLGTGDADFNKCFSWFKKLNFNRWFVFQSSRGATGSEFTTMQQHINFINKKVSF